MIKKCLFVCESSYLKNQKAESLNIDLLIDFYAKLPILTYLKTKLIQKEVGHESK